MAQLTCQNLELGYDGVTILKDISFKVEQGDYLCIIGENGTGKSTLMKAILGLIQPMKGEILWGDGCKAGEIGYLTQQSQIQREFPASVKEIVYSGFQKQCGWRPFYNRAEKEMAHALMRKMGIDQYAKRCYRKLSGGQQQRVLLARALCATQKILFLDEPVTGLDPKVSAEMYEVVKELNEKDGVTIIMISHDVRTAVKYADHVLLLGEKIQWMTQAQYRQKTLEDAKGEEHHD